MSQPETAVLLYHGTEDGNREDTNIFHEVPEVWLDHAAAANRQRELTEQYRGNPTGFVHRKDVPVNRPLGRFGHPTT